LTLAKVIEKTGFELVLWANQIVA